MKQCLIRFCAATLFVWLTACDKHRSDAEYYASATEYYAAGDLEATLVETRNALGLNPENVKARLLRARVNLRLDEPAAAADDLLRAQELGSGDTQLKPLLARALYRQSKFEKVLAIASEIRDPVAQSDLKVTQALAASALGNRFTANTLIREALKLDPAAVYAKLAKAKIELARKDKVASRKSVGEILQQHPDYGPAWSLLARIEIAAGDLDAADEALTKAINLQPEPFDDLLARAQLRIAHRRFDAADADLQRLERQNGSRIGITDDATDDAGLDSRRIQLQDGRSLGLAYVRGLYFHEQQQYEAAAAVFEKILGQAPDYLPALLLAGVTEFELGRNAQAEQKMRRSIELVPDLPVASRLLAMSRLRQGDVEEAESVLREALRKRPADPMLIILSAQVHLVRNDSEAAVKLLRQAVALQPESPQVRLALADGLSRSNKSAEAETEVETALSFDPALATASTSLVSLRLGRGESDSALKAALDFAQANSALPAAHNLLASTYLLRNEFDAARNSFARTLELSPGDTIAHQGLAQLDIQSGHADLARGHYEAALEHHPDDLITLVALSTFEAQVGREERSIEILQRAIEAHPDKLEPRLKLAELYLLRDRAVDIPDILNPVRTRYPNDVSLLSLLADSARRTGQINTAIALYQHAARLAPGNANLQYAIAQSEAASGELTHYAERLLAALKLDPMLHPARVDYARELVRGKQLEAAGEQLAWLRQQPYVTPDTLLLEGRVLEASNDLAGAEGKYRQLFDLAPNNINLLWLVNILGQQQQYAEAIARLNDWLVAHPDDPPVQLQLVRLYEQTEKRENAILVLEQLISVHPDNFVALNNLAWLLRDSSPTRALELAERANTLAPESAQIMDTLSVLLLSHGGEPQLRQAIQLNRRVLEELPNEPLVNLHAAQLQRAAGDINGARATLRALVQKHPDHEARIEAEQLMASLEE